MPIILNELINEFDHQLQKIRDLWAQQKSLCEQLNNAPAGFNKLYNATPPEFSFCIGWLFTAMVLAIGVLFACSQNVSQEDGISNALLASIVILGISFILRTFFKASYDVNIEKWNQLKPQYDSLTKTIDNEYEKIRSFISNVYRWIKSNREQINLDGTQLRRLSYYHNQYILKNSKYDSQWVIGLLKMHEILCNENTSNISDLEDNQNLFGATSSFDAEKDIDKSIEIHEQKVVANHIAFEGRISNADKNRLKQILGYDCMACGINMGEQYAEYGQNYIELHHKLPYSQMKENDVRTLNPSDFYVLCPNCHRMIHKLADASDINTLKSIINRNR